MDAQEDKKDFYDLIHDLQHSHDYEDYSEYVQKKNDEDDNSLG